MGGCECGCIHVGVSVGVGETKCGRKSFYAMISSLFLLFFVVIFPPYQEVDGESLLSLDPQMMVKLMDLKTGPALRIHRKIQTLKKHFHILN